MLLGTTNFLCPCGGGGGTLKRFAPPPFCGAKESVLSRVLIFMFFITSALVALGQRLEWG